MQDRQCSAVEVAQKLNQEDDNGEKNNNGKVDKTKPGYLSIEGASYRITHPLSRLGLESASKL